MKKSVFLLALIVLTVPILSVYSQSKTTNLVFKKEKILIQKGEDILQKSVIIIFKDKEFL